MAELGESRRVYKTGVAASQALLPAPPSNWSYSALKEVEACPRKYALSRARYPDLWGGRGYPRLPTTAALMGDVIHDALETIVTALADHGCRSATGPAAIGVLRGLNGLTAVVERSLARRLERLMDNPRIDAERRRRLTRDLGARVADGRAQVQEHLSRLTFAANPPAAPSEHGGEYGLPRPPRRRPLPTGAHPEVPLTAEGVRLHGQVDLIVVTDSHARIVDYKTGVEDAGHIEQVQMYALMWSLDRTANPAGIPATELVVSYPRVDVSLIGPSADELHAQKREIIDRIAAADRAEEDDVPTAVPSPEGCALCHVRQLCDTYWQDVAADPTEVPDGAWFDLEAVVGPPNGVNSRWMLSPGTGRRLLLLRTTPASAALKDGDTVRILGLRAHTDPDTDGDITVAYMSASAEVFRRVEPVNGPRAAPAAD
ncbi:PD-(D/E)XK nuclease family protein [Mycobacterium sp. SMC-17]|uniref:PD-(D/E)XK nuclease family protein n=1 Tax=Mycobacterium sp. SMC-17 TaxID=3381628 RepID=UPI003877117E